MVPIERFRLVTCGVGRGLRFGVSGLGLRVHASLFRVDVSAQPLCFQFRVRFSECFGFGFRSVSGSVFGVGVRHR